MLVLTKIYFVNFFDALNSLGIPTVYDQAQATTAGATFVPTDIHPTNQTRADARRSYYDPYLQRPNFHVITGQHVTQLLIDGSSSNQAGSQTNDTGDQNGSGTSGSGGGGGLGFGPLGSNYTGSEPYKRHLRRVPEASGHRITGVEVCSGSYKLSLD